MYDIRVALLGLASRTFARRITPESRQQLEGRLMRLVAANMVFTRSASGRVPIDQLTTRPSKQSLMGDRYTLPAAIWNSMMSVSDFSFGVAAWKSRLMRLSGAGLISPR